MYGLQIKFQIDTCVSMRHLMIQITSVPTLAHTEAPPSAWIYHNQHHEMKQYLTMIRGTCDIPSDLPDVTTTTSDDEIPDLVDVLNVVWFA